MNKFTRNVREIPNGDGKRPNNDGNAAFYGYGGSVPFPVTYTPMQAGIFNIYLFGVIEDAMQFISAIEVLQQATENDIVYIHLSTDGGSLDATDTFLSAMRDCQARVVVKASGGVHSAGTVILLNADEFFLSDNFNALIHNGSCGSGGKFSDFVAHSKHNMKYMETVMYNTYAGFLTDEEIAQMLDGKDFWLNGDEFAERFNARNEIIAKQMEEAEAAFAELVEAASAAKPKAKKKAAAVE
jgi:ATP-dependent protease ClpP protease subunit